VKLTEVGLTTTAPLHRLVRHQPPRLPPTLRARQIQREPPKRIRPPVCIEPSPGLRN